MNGQDDTKKLIQQAIEDKDYASLEQHLMRDAVDSGELTKAFASAWAQRSVNGQNDNQEQEADSVQETADEQQNSQPKPRRGVVIQHGQ